MNLLLSEPPKVPGFYKPTYPPDFTPEFPTKYRPKRREISLDPDKEVESWFKEYGAKLGPLIPPGRDIDIKRLLYTYKDLNATNIE